MVEQQRKKIKSEEDVESLMKTYGRFYDVCIKELRYTNGQYIVENSSMNLINTLKTYELFFNDNGLVQLFRNRVLLFNLN